ncbi:cob(I)alamin adenosyltransferase [Limimonas halophila]|uniref:Corrinoid adenosyltransferase n=1 Tax=Limimonas halophila TaxID=1082479 RepID=A0A1G7UGR9_9PROT|nr:cob(I)yrinic acid a,c-diamide adenosyltransferase [Limimonas halophila]SDG46703.1 cob(I)alamin adenosyltransferase [Limimonas halophila]
MVQLTRIYTRGGDKGQTSLGSGRRVRKHDPRVTAYGTVDEANAAIGVARLHVPEAIDRMLVRIQNDLFDVGADLCTPEQDEPEFTPLRVTEDQVAWLEARVDEINADLPPLKSFVLPGGSAGAAHLHQARCIARRAERDITLLAEDEAINLDALRYMNRLSDLLFVLARHANADGAGDVLWKPGENRA